MTATITECFAIIAHCRFWFFKSKIESLFKLPWMYYLFTESMLSSCSSMILIPHKDVSFLSCHTTGKACRNIYQPRYVTWGYPWLHSTIYVHHKIPPQLPSNLRRMHRDVIALPIKSICCPLTNCNFLVKQEACIFWWPEQVWYWWLPDGCNSACISVWDKEGESR